MTKKELLVKLVEVLNEKKEENAPKITKKSTEFFMETFLDLIMDTVASGEPLKIVDFGNFEKKETKGREGIIQVGEKKGQEFKSENSWKVTFKAGKKFKDMAKGVYVEDKKDVE